jgi:hypothetical protein
VALPAVTASRLLRQPFDAAAGLAGLLPADQLARLVELAGKEPLLPAVAVLAARYAVEDDTDRLTLDLDVATDTGKRLPFGVLEFKSRLPGAALAPAVAALPLRPIKLSKFLWATEV